MLFSSQSVPSLGSILPYYRCSANRHYPLLERLQETAGAGGLHLLSVLFFHSITYYVYLYVFLHPRQLHSGVFWHNCACAYVAFRFLLFEAVSQNTASHKWLMTQFLFICWQCVCGVKSLLFGYACLSTDCLKPFNFLLWLWLDIFLSFFIGSADIMPT